MARFEDIVEDYISDTTEITIKDDKGKEITYSLKLTTDDYVKFMSIEKEIADKKSTEDTYKRQVEQLKKIILRSYPDNEAIRTRIDKIVIDNGQPLLLEIYFKLTLRDREAYNALLEMKAKEIQKIKEDGLKSV